MKSQGEQHTEERERTRALAIAHYRGPDSGILIRALNAEEELAREIHGRTTPFHSAVDIVIDELGYGVEVKTLHNSQRGGVGQVHMNRSARERKTTYARDHRLTLFTVAVDFRKGSPQYYVREGIGSFRLASMRPVKNPRALWLYLLKAYRASQAVTSPAALTVVTHATHTPPAPACAYALSAGSIQSL